MKAFIVLLAVTFVFGDSVDDLCPPVNGDSPVYLPSANCSQFYECTNGIARLLECPAGLEYNAKLNVCDWPESAGCEGSGDHNNTTEVPAVTTSSELTTEQSEVSNVTLSTEEPTATPTEDSNEDKSSESTEKPSEESNGDSNSSEDSNESNGESGEDESIRKACESAEFFLIPHPSDCSKYISCSHGKPYVMACPTGLNFSPLLRICLPPEQAQCLNN